MFAAGTYNLYMPAAVSPQDACSLSNHLLITPLLGFKVAPGEIASVADVPVPVDLGRQ